MQADERSDLGEREIAAERHAEVVPGKAGEEEAARPLGEPESERERENARRPGRPQGAARSQIRRPERAPGPPAGRRRQAAAPRRTCPPRPGTPRRPTRGRRENSRSPSTSRRRRRRASSRSAAVRTPRSCAPSISQTAIVSGAAMRANREKGGNASAPAAPETKAIARRRQPQERITPSTSEPSTLTRGMAVEPARLKEHPSWTVELPSPTIDRTWARFDSGESRATIARHCGAYLE